MCDAMIEYFYRCTSSEMRREDMITDCQNSWGGFPERAHQCFTAELESCLSATCSDIDSNRCFRQASHAADPTAFDEAKYQACQGGDESACGAMGIGLQKRCRERFDECGAFEDVCSMTTGLSAEYRRTVETCLDGDCDSVEECVLEAVGMY